MDFIRSEFFIVPAFIYMFEEAGTGGEPTACPVLFNLSCLEVWLSSNHDNNLPFFTKSIFLVSTPSLSNALDLWPRGNNGSSIILAVPFGG